MVFVMLTNIIEETTYLICEGEHADELVEKAFPVHKEGSIPCAERRCIQKETVNSDVHVCNAGSVKHFERVFGTFQKIRKGYG